jgi:hypothetical protein
MRHQILALEIDGNKWFILLNQAAQFQSNTSSATACRGNLNFKSSLPSFTRTFSGLPASGEIAMNFCPDVTGHGFAFQLSFRGLATP